MTETVMLQGADGSPVFNPFAPGFTDNPYPHYAELREAPRVDAHPLGFWALWRYDEVADLLRSRLSVEDRNVTVGPMREMFEAVYGVDGPRGGVSMLDRDPPDHTRLRRLVSKAFTPRTVEELTPRVQALVDDALDRLAEMGTANFVDVLAFPLPFAVISELLGMPETDHVRLRQLSHLVVQSLEPVVDPDHMRAILAADEELQALAADAIAWKRHHPGDDLLTALIAAEENGDVLGDEELVAQVMLLYIAGHETTVNLVSNGLLALLAHPDQLALWRSRPDLDENAVEELLRFDSPVQMSRRITLAPYDVRGATIPPGTFVIASLASANRDRGHWGDGADRLELDRPNARQHLSFGAGVHHCLGASLARLEGRIALGSLIRRFGDITLAGDVVWNGRINLRGPTAVPVAVR